MCCRKTVDTGAVEKANIGQQMSGIFHLMMFHKIRLKRGPRVKLLFKKGGIA